MATSYTASVNHTQDTLTVTGSTAAEARSNARHYLTNHGPRRLRSSVLGRGKRHADTGVPRYVFPIN